MQKEIRSMIFALLVLTIVTMPFGVANAQATPDLAGIWAGALELPGAELEMIFRVASEPDGVWSATLDVPAQGATGIPVTEVRQDGETIIFDVALIAGIYSGQLNSDGTALEGIWEQSGMQIPLTLQKTLEEMAGPNRPQEPKPPYPYSEVDVKYPNHKAGIELA